jgi:hypothetical protein
MIAAVAREERMRRLGSALGICLGLALLLAACAESPKSAKTAGHAAAGKPLQPAEAADWVRVERVARAGSRPSPASCARCRPAAARCRWQSSAPASPSSCR